MAYRCSTSGETRVERRKRERELKDTERNIRTYIPLRIWKSSIKRTVLLLYFFNNTHTYDVVLSASLKKKKKKIEHKTDLVSVRFGHSLVSDFSIRWFHRIDIGMKGEVRMPASTHSVGTTVRTVSSAPVAWVGFGEVLHTPTYNDILSSMNLSFMLFFFFNSYNSCSWSSSFKTPW